MKILRVSALIALALSVTAARADLADIASEHTDPFKALITEPAPVEKKIEDIHVDVHVEPPKPIVPPVSFKVQALAIDGARRVAVVDFEGQTYVVQEGTPVPDASNPAFTVKTVSDEKVCVYDPRTMRLVTKQLAE